MPQCWALVLPRTAAVPWRGVEISKHVSHDSFQYIYLNNWITEVHQHAFKSYYCLLLWISDKTIIKLGRDSWGLFNRIGAQWMWLFCSLPYGTPRPQAQDWTSFVQGKPGKITFHKLHTKWHCRTTEVDQGGCEGQRRSFRSPQLGNADNFRIHLKTCLWRGPETRAGSELSAANSHPDRIRACTG